MHCDKDQGFDDNLVINDSIVNEAIDVAVPASRVGSGVSIIARHALRFPQAPGVYRMLNADGDVLYVGKARSLKKRVTSYTNPDKQSNRIRRMIAETNSVEVITTNTEVEALLLECNMIKRLKPRYNICLRDDKSFPFIWIAGNHPFPQIAKHRGSQDAPGEYFGPFASAGAVAKSITALQRVFLIRNCSDASFAIRTRPCLQYQIRRCSAPCVGYIDEAAYHDLVAQARRYLSGGSRKIQEQLLADMQAASARLDFETAARLRDRVRALTQLQSHQDIHLDEVMDADVIALADAGGLSCIQVFFFRAGSNYGNRAYFPTHDKSMAHEEILAAFIGQFYDDKKPPPCLFVNGPVAEALLLAEALSLKAGRKVTIAEPKRGAKRNLVIQAARNAEEALARRMSESASQRRLLDGVATAFDLSATPERIEVYDNSHISGTAALGAMIVAGPEGFRKNAYRKFNIKDASITQDDFGMMREVLKRRFARQIVEDPERAGEGWPDLVLIDGGQGQLTAASETLTDLGLGDLPLVAIAKGPDRNAGREKFHTATRSGFSLPPNDPILYFLQRLRDEAHRFVIGGHRVRRQMSAHRSELDEIAGIGAARRKALLHHFGSVRAISRAGITDLETVAGINRTVAKKIYDHFHAG